MDFTHLHVHSHYSLLDGLSKIDQLILLAQNQRMKSLALTDHGAMYGTIEFYKKAKEAGIKPIIGEEFYIAQEKMTDKRPNIDDKRYHLILLAKNLKGYQNLVKLTTKANLEGFYYKPRIDNELLEKHCEGLICLSACLQGRIPRLILANKVDEAEKLALFYKNLFGKDGFYLEIQHHPSIKEQEKVNNILIQMAKKLDIGLVATNDVHYLKKEDAEAQDILMLINTNAKPDDPERLTMKQDDFSFKSQEEMKKDFKDVPQAIENTQKIAEMCNIEFKLGENKLPSFPVPNGKTPIQYLKEICEKGIKEKYPNTNPEIKERLRYELEVIEKTGFASYFLIVWDIVKWAKENGIIVGPGRGSVGGSLVAYLSGITEVDPIEYNLLFERFLNPERISMPDIDLDFADTRRDEVINYARQKYGKDKVAQIITFGTMAARQVVRDVGRSLKYPYSFCDKIAKMIPMNFTLQEALEKIAEFRQVFEQDKRIKKLIEISKKLEGVARHASVHACGVVISSEPLTNLVPLQNPPQNEEGIITQYEMHSIEDLGLLKMDFLGLKNLTIIEEALRVIKKTKGEEIDIGNLPLDDKKTYKLLQNGNTTGVFQLESDGMKKYLIQLKPTKIEDIIAMIALYRPGPIGLIPEYVARKNGKKKVEYLHPKLKPILQDTYGVLIYQEQLMQIAQQLAGFTLAEADILRKAVGKKIKSLLGEQKEKLIKGMMKNKIPLQTAEKIWEWILPFASYGFNRSHATAYAIIAYQTAYLKAHFPVEFMAVLMNTEQKNIDRLTILINEAKKMGIKVLPPDINESLKKFTVVNEKTIRFGLGAIKNVGVNIVEKIVQERKENGSYKSITDFLERVNGNIINKKSLESLIKAGVFDTIETRQKLLYNLQKLLDFAQFSNRQKTNGQASLFQNTNSNIPPITFDAPEKNGDPNQELFWEKELLGIFVSSHPMEKIKKISTLNIIPIEKIGKYQKKRNVRIAGVITKIKKTVTRNGENMLFAETEDSSGRIEALIFPKTQREYSSLIQENKIVMMMGRVSEKDGVPKIICEEVREIKI
ncbi:MAG: DNA polymerase III subunit alpha [Candidatus Pacebacteria bacterium]|nr:DNA polymerase III subunit alpha [Candidatus Paceibacterota bacterium]